MKTTTSHYLVGYGRPPQQHQYKPGQSGNPTGRPKGARSAMADWRDELAELVSVKVGEQTVQLAQHRALVKETYERLSQETCTRQIWPSTGMLWRGTPSSQRMMSTLMRPIRPS